MDGTGIQLRLLPAPQPLVERLGADFFRSIPESPGVYRMYDAADRLVYVGKAGNLRDRLGSYRRTHGQSRKTVRLIHEVRRIEWELCPSEAAARLRENELIRTLRPRFNRAGTWPRSARFVTLEVVPPGAGVAPDPGGFRLLVAGAPEGESYGAFRGGAALALGALARLLWLAWHRTPDLRVLPMGLMGLEGVRRFDALHTQAAAWVEDVRAFLGAVHDTLAGRLVAAVPEPPTPFGRAYVAWQFETLAEFYRRGPLRNRRLCEATDTPLQPIAPERLDELLILAPAVETAPSFRPPA